MNSGLPHPTPEPPFPASPAPGWPPILTRSALLAALALLALISTPSTRAALQPPPDAHLHWAFQPPQPSPPPPVHNTRWPVNDLDRFILAQLEAEGRQPLPPADPRTFIRRAHATLTGLPPSFDEVQSFTREALPHATPGNPLHPAAVERLVNRLLDSPHYGERWGRHWLDVARYSDTKGYVYAREERRFVHAHTYRDWVVRAFNQDLPYNQFLLLQIAADQVAPPDSPDLAAMGFITGGRRFLGVTHDIIDDRIDVVTRGTLGLTVQCARCHDHKYDPVPIQDYYSLYGVFHATDVQLVPLATLDDPELAKRRTTFSQTYAKRRAEANARLHARVADYLTAQLELHQYPEEGFDQILGDDDLIPASVRRWRDFLLTHRNPADPILGPWHTLAPLADLEPNAFTNQAAAALDNLRRNQSLNPLVAQSFTATPASIREVARLYGQTFLQALKEPTLQGAAELRAFLDHPDSPARVPDTGIVNTEAFFPTPITEELWKLQGDIDRRLLELGAPAALILTDRPAEPDPRVFVRGSPARLGDPVPRRFLQVLSRDNDRQPFQQGSGRLELARAIIDPANPLTARVMVNRIWHHHFGRGLVPTTSDFGLRADPPSHPRLLDWLALRFIAEGWSVKAIHRLILTSATYQQAGPDTLRRLDFEQLRDAMLAASGELDRSPGGPSSELLSPSNLRRTLYATVDRQFLPGVFRTFDFANPDIHVAVRHETTVPQQALFFLNGAFAASRAQALANTSSTLPPHDRVRHLHHTLFQREPSSAEIHAALRFIEAARHDTPPRPEPPRPTPWSYGTGKVDPAGQHLESFTPLPHFTGSAWQGAESWPGGKTGWAQLTATGGHPGDTPAHAAARRWTSPSRLTITIQGTLHHEPEAGDGIRAFILSSRHGRLLTASVHHDKTNMSAGPIDLEPGDTLDFVVDIAGNLNSDQFLWTPTITGPDQSWNAGTDFTGPNPSPVLLQPWAQYAQVLLLSNEFAFVD